jgi:hypothetical protein
MRKARCYTILWASAAVWITSHCTCGSSLVLSLVSDWSGRICIGAVWEQDARKSSVFRYILVMSCNPVKGNQLFGGICRLHQQNSNTQLSLLIPSLWFLRPLDLNPVVGDNVFLRNVGRLSSDYTHYIPEGRTLHSSNKGGTKPAPF